MAGDPRLKGKKNARQRELPGIGGSLRPVGVGEMKCYEMRPAIRGLRQACLRSKNCSSSVEPFSAPVDASRSIVVVTASK